MEYLVAHNSSEAVSCRGKVLEGDVVAGIWNYATAGKTDLLIIGTHGAKGLEKIRLGSVAESLVKKAPCPVLTFNPYRQQLVRLAHQARPRWRWDTGGAGGRRQELKAVEVWGLTAFLVVALSSSCAPMASLLRASSELASDTNSLSVRTST